MDTLVAGNPYPGLRPFQAEETHLFFGRDEQRIELLHRLRRTRFLAIVGTSGSGKSSLVRAGLLPGLHGGFMAGPSDTWRIVDLRPGTDAIGNLARALDAPGALRDTPAAADEPSFTAATLRRSGLGLVDVVREARLPAADKVLVLVDQFEELFRAIEAADRPQSGDDASAFVTLLLEAAKQPELPIYVVLTMRSDFLGECARFRGLPEAINDGQYLVPRLTPDQRIQAITGPAAVFGVTLASTLVNRLLNDVGENPDQLPILQHALMRTWERWKQRPIDPAAPREIGLADYLAIGGMAKALSLHADAVFDGLAIGCRPEVAAQRQRIAEKLFKCLAGIGAGGLAVRRLARLQEIVDVSGAPLDEVIGVVEAFRAPGNSFLMPPPGEPLGPGRYVDISHESLIRNWVRMTGWVEDESESARVYERLSSTALLHDQGKAALWHQPDLGVALQWRDTHKPNAAWARRYNTSFERAMAFLDASQARAQASEDTKSRRRRVWVFSIVVVFLTMGTVILTWARDELGRIDTMLQQAKRASDDLAILKAITELQAARESGGVAADAAKACASRPELNSSVVPPPQLGLFDKLCRPGTALNNDERSLIAVYRQVIDGQWADASQGIDRLPTGYEQEDSKRLIGQLAATRSPADRIERRLLLDLQKLRNQSSGEPLPEDVKSRIDRLVHPVHRRIARALSEPGSEPTAAEEQLLAAYASAESARFATNGAAVRKAGWEAVEKIRSQPGGQPYSELARIALSTESKVTEAFEIGMNVMRDYVWIFLVFMVWPAWRLRRFVQRRLGQPIRTRPNPARLVVAATVDITIAVAVGILAAFFVEAVVEIGAILLKARSRSGDAAGALSGIGAGMAYLLCRDALRLRVRRSIGKALFDLRPLMTQSADAGALTVRASAQRNVILPAIVLALLLLMEVGGILGVLAGITLVVGWWIVSLVILIRGRQTLGERWSKTRVVDSDCAEALAARP